MDRLDELEHNIDAQIAESLQDGFIETPPEKKGKRRALESENLRKFSLALQHRDYLSILKFLMSSEGKQMSLEEKSAFNLYFDHELICMEQERKKLNEIQLRLLSQIKKILIVFELDVSGVKGMDYLKEKVRAHVENDRPLQSLLRKPFVAEIQGKQGKGKLKYYFNDIIEAYRAVLQDLSQDVAGRIHRRQREYLETMDNFQLFKQYVLREINQIEMN